LIGAGRPYRTSWDFEHKTETPEVVDVLGTWLLSILDGQRRYAHVTGLRGDEVAPQIFGMNKIISDESLRRALAHLAPNQPRHGSDAERAARSTATAPTGMAPFLIAVSTASEPVLTRNTRSSPAGRMPASLSAARKAGGFPR
jgi:hypothetical protein